MSTVGTSEAVSRFGIAVAARFATAGGEPEELLRHPLDDLVQDLARLVSIPRVVLAGEHHLAAIRVRPDFAVYVREALAGFIEVKAPGKGVNPARYRGHDREQWARLRDLPNLLLTDGQAFALFRDGERIANVVQLVGDVETAGASLADPGAGLVALVDDFLRWDPIPPRRPRDLALTIARLCRLLRAEVEDLMTSEAGLQALAEDWRRLLFPDATDREFADGYAQTITFALLLARVDGIDLHGRELRDVASDLGRRHTLMGRALDVLTDPAVLPRLAVSVQTLQRVLGVVDWPTISRGDRAAWLYFYEDFLAGYDPALRRATGSYYTPAGVVTAMVRLVDDILRVRLGRRMGLASSDVTVVDPAVGTGTFLVGCIDHIAARTRAEEGGGAVAPRLRESARRLIGFEIQTGPYSVAEVRVASDLADHGAPVGAGALRLYLTDTLANPYEAEEHLGAVYAPIAESRRRANEVKRSEPVLVVIGNPPYRERSRGRGGWIERGNPGAQQRAPLGDYFPPADWGVGAHVKHVYNPYVYFWRWATWKVFEHHPGDRGVVAMISVAGFLAGPGFAGMRAHLRRTADAIWVIDCSPEGHQPDVPTRVFQGVQQPVCIVIAVRDGSTDADTPAPVLFTAVHGHRDEKFDALAGLDLFADGWRECVASWGAPFLPASSSGWASMPALDDLLGWSGSGTMPGRTWVVAPSATVLRLRWLTFVTASPERKPELLAEHPRDRRVDTVLREDLPGFESRGRPLLAETDTTPRVLRYGYRSFDRQWLIADKRVINQPNPGLWQVRDAPGQLFLTALARTSPSSGPAVTFTSLVPDLDHYKGRGGRAYPLWLNRRGDSPNVVPGLLEYLEHRYGMPVAARDLYAYIAAVLAHPGFVHVYRGDLGVPGLRVPLTADASLFDRAVDLGRCVIWLHTFGERDADIAANRPPGPPKVVGPRRPKVVVAIPDGSGEIPTHMEYDRTTEALVIGPGRVQPVAPAVWDYEVSGMRVLPHWFDRRKRDPSGRRSSPLDDLVVSAWEPDWTTELLEVVNVLTLLVDLEPQQAALLEDIVGGPVVSVSELTTAGVLPVTARPAVERPGIPPTLFGTDG